MSELQTRFTTAYCTRLIETGNMALRQLQQNVVTLKAQSGPRQLILAKRCVKRNRQDASALASV